MKLEDDGSGDNKEEDVAIDEVQTDDESDDTQVSKSQTSRFANLQNISFNFAPYDQDSCIIIFPTRIIIINIMSTHLLIPF